MSLCILTSSYPRRHGDADNAGVFVRDFAGILSRRGMELSVFTHRKAGAASYAETFPVREYPWLGRETSLTSLRLASPGDFVKAASLMAMGTFHYLRHCREQRVTYSLAMWAVPSGAFALAAKIRRGIPYSVWALGSDIWRYERNRLTRPVITQILRGAHRLFADGDDLARRVTALCGRPCEYLPSARELAGVIPNPVKEESSRPRFVFVGRFEPNKGPDILVDAAARYLSLGGRGGVDVFGEGSMERDLYERIRKLGVAGRVRMHGAIGPADMAGRLDWCDYLVIPSRIESIPVVLSDALQRGAPVIVADVGDMGTLVRSAGIGMVVRPRDPEALAAAMLESERVDRAAFQNSVRKASRNFDLRASAARFIETTGLDSAL